MTMLLAVIGTGLIIGLAKGGLLGPVAGALILPLLSQTMTVSQAVGVTLPLLMFADVFALRFYWREWETYYLKLLLPLAVVGIAMGTTLVATLPDDVLRRLLGVITLLVVVYKLTGVYLTGLEYTPRRWHGYLAGLGAGFASALANAGGPPVTTYLLLQRISPTAFVGTLALFFAILNVIKLPGFLAAGILDVRLVGRVIWALPVIPFGVWVGRRGVGRMDPRIFDCLMTVLLFLAGLFLLLQ